MDIQRPTHWLDEDHMIQAEQAISDQLLRLAGIALLALGVAGAYAMLVA
jgi:uncharacterized protein YjeT (DUF2065 family)